MLDVSTRYPAALRGLRHRIPLCALISTKRPFCRVNGLLCLQQPLTVWLCWELCSLNCRGIITERKRVEKNRGWAGGCLYALVMGAYDWRTLPWLLHVWISDEVERQEKRERRRWWNRDPEGERDMLKFSTTPRSRCVRLCVLRFVGFWWPVLVLPAGLAEGSEVILVFCVWFCVWFRVDLLDSDGRTSGFIWIKRIQAVYMMDVSNHHVVRETTKPTAHQLPFSKNNNLYTILSFEFFLQGLMQIAFCLLHILLSKSHILNGCLLSEGLEQTPL